DHFPELEGSRSGPGPRDRGGWRRLPRKAGELRRAERENPGIAATRIHAYQAARDVARPRFGEPRAREAVTAGRADRNRQPALFRQLPGDRSAARRARPAAAVA